jgi:hypothetical protein
MSITRPQGEFFPRIGAGCLVMLGLFMFISAVFALAVPPLEEVAGLIVMATLGAGFGGAGVYWWRFVTGSEVRRRGEFHDKVVLGIAAAHGGQVTIAQVAVESELTAEEAREALERLCRRGLALPDILEDGSIQYRFGGLLGP